MRGARGTRPILLPPPHCAPDGTLFLPSLCPRQLDKNVFKRADDTQERKRIELVAFFSNPRGAGAELHLMREIQELFDAAQWGYEGATAAVHASAPARRPCPPLPCPPLHYPSFPCPMLALPHDSLAPSLLPPLDLPLYSPARTSTLLAASAPPSCARRRGCPTSASYSLRSTRRSC